MNNNKLTTPSLQIPSSVAGKAKKDGLEAQVKRAGRGVVAGAETSTQRGAKVEIEAEAEADAKAEARVGTAPFRAVIALTGSVIGYLMYHPLFDVVDEVPGVKI